MELWCRGDEDSLTSKLVGCPHHLSTKLLKIHLLTKTVSKHLSLTP